MFPFSLGGGKRAAVTVTIGKKTARLPLGHVDVQGTSLRDESVFGYSARHSGRPVR